MPSFALDHVKNLNPAENRKNAPKKDHAKSHANNHAKKENLRKELAKIHANKFVIKNNVKKELAKDHAKAIVLNNNANANDKFVVFDLSNHFQIKVKKSNLNEFRQIVLIELFNL